MRVHKIPHCFLVMLFGFLVMGFISRFRFYGCTHVPITLQACGLIFLSVLMAPSGAFLAMLGWIVGGWLGLPCFASDSARGVLMGQNAGYIWGYVCAVPMTSFLIRSSAVKKVLFSSAVRIFLCGFLGMLIVYFLGWLRLSSFLGMRNAYKMGICPFVWGDLAKLIAATATTRVFLTIKVKDIDFFNGV